MRDCDSYLPELKSADSVSSLTPYDIFGVNTKLHKAVVDTIPRLIDGHSYALTDNFVYGILVVVAFVLFCYIVYSHRASIPLLVKGMWRNKMSDDYTGVFRQFTSVVIFMGIIQGTILSLKVTEYFVPDISRMIYPSWLVYLLPVAVIVALMGYAFFRKFISFMIGRVVNEEVFLEQYDFFASQWASFCTLLLVPVIWILAFSYGGELVVLVGVISVVGALMYVVYLIRSYRFFNSRGVSILQWILYLCTIEFLPISLLVFIRLRYS